MPIKVPNYYKRHAHDSKAPFDNHRAVLRCMKHNGDVTIIVPNVWVANKDEASDLASIVKFNKGYASVKVLAVGYFDQCDASELEGK